MKESSSSPISSPPSIFYSLPSPPIAHPHPPNSERTMSELWFSTTSRAQLFLTRLLSDFSLFCSFIFSHPLYFSYFIFFSPYLLKLVSFLSPLFFTTSLLLLSFLTFFPHDHHFSTEFPSHKNMGFLLATYHALLSILRSKVSNYHSNDDQEYLKFEDSAMFKIVFDHTPLINDDNTTTTTTTQVEEEIFFQALEENEPEFSTSAHQDFSSKETKLKSFLEETEECETESGLGCNNSVDKQKTEPISTETNKVAEMSPVRNGSKAERNKLIQTNKVDDFAVSKDKNFKQNMQVPLVQQCICKSEDRVEMKIESSRTLDYDLGSYGSSRKEKEWKRTLACKLFEERHNVVEGGEGMDLLWETYEAESSKNKAKSRKEKKNKKKYHEVRYSHGGDGDNCDDEDDEEDDESNGQLCCLQALKFSSGKMNLGMGKPSIVKITKAIKGFGWLHQISRRSKKVHNGDKFF